MREVISQRAFDDVLFKQLSLSKIPQPVHAVPVWFQNNSVDKLTVSTDRIPEIFRTSTAVYSVKKKPQTTWNDVTETCHTLERSTWT